LRKPRWEDKERVTYSSPFLWYQDFKILKLSPTIAFKVKAKGGICLQEESFHGVAVERSMGGDRP